LSSDQWRTQWLALLKALQFLELLSPHAAILLPPTVVRLLGSADLPDRIRSGHSLADKNLDLPQLADDLFRFRSLVRHL